SWWRPPPARRASPRAGSTSPRSGSAPRACGPADCALTRLIFGGSSVTVCPMQFNFAHDFDIDVPGYWKIFLSPEFNQDMFMNELKMRKYEVKEKTDDGKKMHRIQELEPSVPIPGFLQSVVKSTGYKEIDDLDWS